MRRTFFVSVAVLASALFASCSGGTAVEQPAITARVVSTEDYCAAVREGLAFIQTDASIEAKKQKFGEVVTKAQSVAPDEVRTAYHVAFGVAPGDVAAAQKTVDDYNMSACQVDSADLRTSLTLPNP
jgi:hypothetical protein